MFFDQRRKSELREKTPIRRQPELTEDEAPPTATGRMKIQPVLQALQKQKQSQTKPVKDSPDEDEALPDPFASGITKRPQK